MGWEGESGEAGDGDGGRLEILGVLTLGGEKGSLDAIDSTSDEFRGEK